MTAQEIYDRGMSNPLCDMHDHLEFLKSVSRGEVLEIGVCQGYSTAALLLGGGNVTSIDIEDCSQVIQHPGWNFIQADSTLIDWEKKIDLILIDGDHSWPAVKSDMEKFIPLVKPGGLVLMHDVLQPRYPGVRKAFDEWPGEKEIRPGSFGMGIIRA